MLQGTGPWNLEVQVVGPKSLDVLQFPGITNSRERLPIPIPKAVDKDGGFFDIDISEYSAWFQSSSSDVPLKQASRTPMGVNVPF